MCLVVRTMTRRHCQSPSRRGRRRAKTANLLPSLALAALSVVATTAPAAETLRVDVPIDHALPDGGSYEVIVEFGAPFDPRKPTVFVIADGQQFYVREGAVSRLQDDLFGREINVAGLIGRGSLLSHEAARSQVIDATGEVDWAAAWRLLRAAQWIEDIEAVRAEVLGERGKVMLFGRSGGGLLVHQYLTIHGDNVSRAFTSAPVANPWSAFAGLDADRFWTEIGASSPDAQKRVLALLDRGDFERSRIAMAFQRQNFFVPHDEIAEARLELLALLEAGESGALSGRLDAYQVAAVEAFFASEAAIPSRVRLYEFALPFLPAWRVEPRELNPDIEVVLHAASPLIVAADAGAISAQPPENLLPALRQPFGPEVFVLAARWDHTVDYRGALALAARYADSVFWLADDNHTFAALVEHGLYAALLQSFLVHGTDSPELRAATARAEAHRWRDR